jgi:hypothetical protein
MQAIAGRIAVYRMYQPTLYSPCLLGDPCFVCRQHASCRHEKACRDCKRGRAPECQRAKPTRPAFTVRFNQAMTLVVRGLAEFINRRTALRLTFSKVVHLRDRSLRVDERLLMDYAQGRAYAQAIIDDPAAGWSVQPPVARISRQALKKRVLYFG